MNLLGELGAFVDGPSLLLSSPLGRVEALAVPLSMLLDVLVLGHAGVSGGRGGGVWRALRRRGAGLQTAALSGVPGVRSEGC